MANTGDSRVIATLAHAKDCQEAIERGEKVPDLPSTLTDLSGIDLKGANLSSANLSGANLLRTWLNRANLTHANLTGANLISADLTEANLIGAKLINADLTKAELYRANLSFTDLTNVKVAQDQLNWASYVDVAKEGYPKEVAEKVILLQELNPDYWKRQAKKRLVVELRADGKLHIKTPIFKY